MYLLTAKEVCAALEFNVTYTGDTNLTNVSDTMNRNVTNAVNHTKEDAGMSRGKLIVSTLVIYALCKLN